MFNFLSVNIFLHNFLCREFFQLTKIYKCVLSKRKSIFPNYFIGWKVITMLCFIKNTTTFYIFMIYIHLRRGRLITIQSLSLLRVFLKMQTPALFHNFNPSWEQYFISAYIWAYYVHRIRFSGTTDFVISIFSTN